jgi:hypothetical protein
MRENDVRDLEENGSGRIEIQYGNLPGRTERNQGKPVGSRPCRDSNTAPPNKSQRSLEYANQFGKFVFQCA